MELCDTDKGDKFKISNDYIAYYTRLLQHYHPEHENFYDQAIEEIKRGLTNFVKKL